jgi:elongation of very long chain fatty acids protein 6
MNKDQLKFSFLYCLFFFKKVLIYCWYSTSEFASSGRWFVFMNYSVHACMYSYYAFRALRFNIPKWVNIVITSAQLSQMIIGIFLNCYVYLKHEEGVRCDVSRENIKWSFFMYFTYFLLFFKFFYEAYIAPKAKQPHSTTDHSKHFKHNGHHVTSNGNGHVKDSNNNINKKHD